MAIKSRDELQKEKRKIDLTGPEGNAYVILSIAREYAAQLDFNWETIRSEMTSGDYENLISVFDSYFGDYADLYR